MFNNVLPIDQCRKWNHRRVELQPALNYTILISGWHANLSGYAELSYSLVGLTMKMYGFQSSTVAIMMYVPTFVKCSIKVPWYWSVNLSIFYPASSVCSPSCIYNISTKIILSHHWFIIVQWQGLARLLSSSWSPNHNQLQNLAWLSWSCVTSMHGLQFQAKDSILIKKSYANR